MANLWQAAGVRRNEHPTSFPSRLFSLPHDRFRHCAARGCVQGPKGVINNNKHELQAEELALYRNQVGMFALARLSAAGSW